MKRLFLTLSLLFCCFLGLNAQKKQAVSVLYVGGSPEIETIGIGTPPDPAIVAKYSDLPPAYSAGSQEKE